MLPHIFSVPASISALALITACSSNPPRIDTVHNPPSATSQTMSFGIVSAATSTSGGGALPGAVIGGGVFGHQVGGGSGRTAATALGIVGGAVIGNPVVQRNKPEGDICRTSMRLNNGSMAQFDYQRIDDLRVGDRVKGQDGQLYRV